MESTFYAAQVVFAILLWGILWVGPLCAILWVGYYLISLRMRRQERARFFLDLLETGLSQSRRIEEIIISVSNSRDSSMGVYFHLLAFHLREGVPFNEALDKVPRLLPAQITAMLRAGLKIGELAKTLPACRKLSKDALSQTRGAINYLVLIAFIGFPTNLVLITLLQIYVLPQFLSVVTYMGGVTPIGLSMVMRFRGLIFLLQFLMFLTVWCAALVYIDGPGLFRWWENFSAPFTHRILYALPWRRKRMQRDFSGMLGILIDAGMPEAESVRTAADCTANRIFQKRAASAVKALEQGMTLPEAVRLVDDTGEFHWRLTNAMRSSGGFFQAIAGWNESLDAKAFQLEQATAQAVTTGIVMLNGLMVGFIVISVFSALVAIINQSDLW